MVKLSSVCIYLTCAEGVPKQSVLFKLSLCCSLVCVFKKLTFHFPVCQVPEKLRKMTDCYEQHVNASTEMMNNIKGNSKWLQSVTCCLFINKLKIATVANEQTDAA